MSLYNYLIKVESHTDPQYLIHLIQNKEPIGFKKYIILKLVNEKSFKLLKQYLKINPWPFELSSCESSFGFYNPAQIFLGNYVYGKMLTYKKMLTYDNLGKYIRNLIKFRRALLIIAIRNNDLEIVKYFIDQDKPIFVKYDLPIRIAAKHGNLEMIKYLRAKGYLWNSKVTTILRENNHSSILEWAGSACSGRIECYYDYKGYCYGACWPRIENNYDYYDTFGEANPRYRCIWDSQTTDSNILESCKNARFGKVFHCPCPTDSE